MSILSMIAGSGLLGSLASLFRGLQFVKEGERGALLRFGKFRRVVSPGFIFVIPWIDTIQRTHVRQNTINLPNQVVTLKDGLAFKVSSVVIYHVTDVYKALFDINDVHTSIINIALAVMRELLSERDYEGVRSLKELNEKLIETLRHRVSSWGVGITSFEISDFAPTPDTAQLLLAVNHVRKQVEGNLELLKHLEDVEPRLKGMSRSPLALALVMRGGAHGTASLLLSSGAASRHDAGHHEEAEAGQEEE